MMLSEWYKPTLLDMFEITTRLNFEYSRHMNKLENDRRNEEQRQKYMDMLAPTWGQLRTGSYNEMEVRVLPKGGMTFSPVQPWHIKAKNKLKGWFSNRKHTDALIAGMLLLALIAMLWGHVDVRQWCPIGAVAGVTNSWQNGGVNNLASTVGNWDKGHVPAAGEDIVWNIAGWNCTFDYQIAAVASTTIGVNMGTFNVTVSQATAGAWGAFTVHGGTINWTVAGGLYAIYCTTYTMDGGTINGVGGAALRPTSNVNITGGTWTLGILFCIGSFNISCTISIAMLGTGGAGTTLTCLTNLTTASSSDIGNTLVLGTHNLTCNGSLNLGNGSGNGNITVSTGIIVVSTTLNMTHPTKTGAITFSGAGSLTVAGAAIIGGAQTGTITPAAGTTITFNNTVTIASGAGTGSLGSATAWVLQAAGLVTINATGTMIGANTAGYVRFSAGLTIAAGGVFTKGTGEFRCAAAQTITDNNIWANKRDLGIVHITTVGIVNFAGVKMTTLDEDVVGTANFTGNSIIPVTGTLDGAVGAVVDGTPGVTLTEV